MAPKFLEKAERVGDGQRGQETDTARIQEIGRKEVTVMIK